ncbi:MAG: aldo/keto reductase, partial [Rhodobacteraceae bacterium]|nr:aldo/keto reductase [Paracoccaceae bacterium]
MQPSAKKKFGRVDLDVSAFGFGTAPVGNIFREIDEDTSDAMYQA